MSAAAPPLKKARRNLLELVRDSAEADDRFVVIRKGSSERSEMDVREFNDWLGTLGLVSDPGAVPLIRRKKK